MLRFNKKRVLYHLMAWIALYGVWVLIFKDHSFTLSRTLTVQFCYLLFILLDYYLIIYLLVPKILFQKGLLAFVLLNLSVIIISASLRAWLALYMNAHFFMPGKPQPDFYLIFQNSVLNIFIWVQLLTAIKMLWDKLLSHRYISAVEHQRTLNELNFLKAQVNPHFLFNSLNSLYGHIDKNNRTARSILLKFSELLRYQLYECSVEKISLKKEIEYIRNYVSLQQYRKEEDLIVTVNIDEDLAEFQVAPLILVVFIENAFKHVSAGRDLNKIEINLSKTLQMLELNLYNTTEPEDENALRKQGIGLINVQRRLDLLYPDRYSLITARTESFYEVNLKLDLT